MFKIWNIMWERKCFRGSRVRNSVLPGTCVEICLHSAVNMYLNNIFFFHTTLISLLGRLSLNDSLWIISGEFAGARTNTKQGNLGGTGELWQNYCVDTESFPDDIKTKEEQLCLKATIPGQPESLEVIMKGLRVFLQVRPCDWGPDLGKTGQNL